MHQEKAKEAAATSVMNAFPLSGCSRDCLEKQLDNYYKEKCKGSVPALRYTKIPAGKDTGEEF